MNSPIDPVRDEVDAQGTKTPQGEMAANVDNSAGKGRRKPNRKSNSRQRLSNRVVVVNPGFNMILVCICVFMCASLATMVFAAIKVAGNSNELFNSLFERCGYIVVSGFSLLLGLAGGRGASPDSRRSTRTPA